MLVADQPQLSPAVRTVVLHLHRGTQSKCAAKSSQRARGY
jgi:hypothetical protein